MSEANRAPARCQVADFKGIMNIFSQRRVRCVFVGFLLLGACSRVAPEPSGSTDLYQSLLARLGSGSETALYAAAAVHTPRGLWNVYILSAPPDRMIFRQSRQDAEIEFGLTDDYIWREDMLTGQSRALSGQWRYFVRSYEIFRLGSQLARWRPLDSRADCREIAEEIAQQEPAEIDLCLVDQSGSRIAVTIGEDGLPSRIVRELPAEFGGGSSIITPSVWTPRDDELLMTGFDQDHGDDSFSWDIQSIDEIPEHEISINPPDQLE